MTIPDTPWHPEPKFRLTDIGRAAIAPDDKGKLGAKMKAKSRAMQGAKRAKSGAKLKAMRRPRMH